MALNHLSARRRSVGLLLILAFLLVVFVHARPLGHLNTGDSNNLVAGTRLALTCLDDGQFTKCGLVAGSTHTEVFPYPVLQYIPSAVMIVLDKTDSEVIGALGGLNFLSFVALLALVLVTFRTRRETAMLLILVLLMSSLLYQSTSAFGEGLAAAAIGAAVLAAVARRPVLLFVLVAIASLGKETLMPFVVILALICARRDEDGWLPARKLSVAVLGGGFVGLVVSMGFNVFRFGTVKNLSYLRPILRTPGVSRKVEFFAATIGSPSAGLVWFWPVFSFVAVAGAIVGVRRLVLAPRQLRSSLPVLVVVVTLLCWIASLSLWFSPFGWIAYGPRLEVPLLVGVAIALAHLVGESIIRIVRQRRLALLALAGSFLVGAIQLGSPWRHTAAIYQLIAPSGSCPRMTELDVLTDSEKYFRCASQTMWRGRPVVLDDVFELSASVAGSAWLLALAGSLLLLWSSTSRDGADAPAASVPEVSTHA